MPTERAPLLSPEAAGSRLLHVILIKLAATVSADNLGEALPLQ